MTEEVKEIPEKELPKKEEDKPEVPEIPKEEVKDTLKLKEDPNIEIIEGKKYPKEIVEKARIQGWKNKEELEKLGKGGKYKDPDEFAKRGDEIIPFLKKRLEKEEKEKESLKKLLKKHLKSQMSNNLDSIDEKLKDAKEMGEGDKIEKLVQKKINTQQEIKNLEQEKPKKDTTEYDRKRKEGALIMLEWERKNKWVFNPDNAGLKNFANTVFASEQAKGKNIHEILSEVDREVVDYVAKQISTKQKKNLSIPSLGQGSSIAKTGQVSRTVKNLNSTMKQQYNDDCTDWNGKPLKGNDLKMYKETFLSVCKDSDFIA